MKQKYLKLIDSDGNVVFKQFIPFGIDELNRAEWDLRIPITAPIRFVLIEDDEEFLLRTQKEKKP